MRNIQILWFLCHHYEFNLLCSSDGPFSYVEEASGGYWLAHFSGSVFWSFGFSAGKICFTLANMNCFAFCKYSDTILITETLDLYS